MPQPSFKKILNQRIQLFHNKTKKNSSFREEFKILKSTNRKSNAYDFVSKHNIRHPNYHYYNNISDLLDNHSENRLVIKPAGGHSSNGVYILSKIIGNTYYCHMNKRIFLSKRDIRNNFLKKLANKKNYNISEDVLMEEFIKDPNIYGIPYDYKVYAFKTGTPLIMQRLASTSTPKQLWQFQFYNKKGEALGIIRTDIKSKRPPIKTKPKNFKAMIEAAQLLVNRLSVSFVRIDLYESEQGVVFGEFTPLPNLGFETFIPEFDRVLGLHWQNSLEELNISYE